MAYKLVLDAAERTEIQKRLRKTKDVKLLRRYQCLLMLDDQYPKKEAAQILQVNIDTITDWLKLYRKEGLTGLEQFRYENRRGSALDGIREQIAACVQTRLVTSMTGLHALIEKEYGVKINYSWLCRYCKKNNIVITNSSAEPPAGAAEIFQAPPYRHTAGSLPHTGFL